MRTDLFHYQLPQELIAQSPLPRGESRLLVLHRDTGKLEHRIFRDLPEYLRPQDTLVLNDSRVTARRLVGEREGGQPAEVILLHPVGERQWEALVKPGKSLRPGKSLQLLGPLPDFPRISVQIVGTTPEGGRILECENGLLRDRLSSWGEIPLPPYIQTTLSPELEERYQTIYASQDGSAAAPTAGLHFSPSLLEQIEAMGVHKTFVTLHVGVGTFRPVRTNEIEAHQMHGETVQLTTEAATCINQTQGRVIAVGTTSVRTLETSAQPLEASETPTHKRVRPFLCQTNLFITPGYKFQAVDALITNFHLPCSTLLMLVCAFAGYEQTMHAYQEAIHQQYRFFSFGDAMLII